MQKRKRQKSGDTIPPNLWFTYGLKTKAGTSSAPVPPSVFSAGFYAFSELIISNKSSQYDYENDSAGDSHYA